jgi:hypothetical protein
MALFLGSLIFSGKKKNRSFEELAAPFGKEKNKVI